MELIVTVAVIAILVIVALPTLNEAQARAKVSRSKSDLRTIAGAVELYTVDYQTLPPSNRWGLAPPQLSTPISYLAVGFMEDPFATHLRNTPGYSEQWTTYRYNNWSPNLDWSPADTQYVAGMFDRHGSYWLYSNGPALSGFIVPVPGGTEIGEYDPTNGIISPGRVIRSQKANSQNGYTAPRA